MNSTPIPKLRAFACLLGGFLGLELGCPGLSPNPFEPCAHGEHNLLNWQDECECEDDYEWCDPDDPENLDCCEVGSADSTTSGDTGGEGDCAAGEFPPDTCTPEQEGAVWCTNTDAMGPCGSKLYVCESSTWTEASGIMQDNCITDGYDFAYGCVDDGFEVVFECGEGPGTDCLDSDLVYCVNNDQIASCRWGKETWESCQLDCEHQTYEYGECNDSVPGGVVCTCCNAGEPGCPL